jgi:hypothetical protein
MSNRNIIKTYKICRPYVVTLLNQTPILECYLAKLVVLNAHKKDMCYNEIELCAQIMSTALSSIVDAIGRTFVVT